jgi:endonuclease YncB( thermonuclease family)
MIAINTRFSLSLFLTLLAPTLVQASKCDEDFFRGKTGITAKLQDQMDGDTISILYQRKTYKVRLLSMDTPETNFKGKSQGVWGQAAKKRFGEMLSKAKNRAVQIEFNDKFKCDPYGRILGYVHVNGQDLNEQLVREGLAAPFCVFPTLDRCQFYADAYLAAKQDSLGFHSEPDFELPMDFRTRESGRNECAYVGYRDLSDLKAVPFERRNEIPLENLVCFINESDIKDPYSKGV